MASLQQYYEGELGEGDNDNDNDGNDGGDGGDGGGDGQGRGINFVRAFLFENSEMIDPASLRGAADGRITIPGRGSRGHPPDLHPSATSDVHMQLSSEQARSDGQTGRQASRRASFATPTPTTPDRHRHHFRDNDTENDDQDSHEGQRGDHHRPDLSFFGSNTVPGHAARAYDMALEEGRSGKGRTGQGFASPRMLFLHCAASDLHASGQQQDGGEEKEMSKNQAKSWTTVRLVTCAAPCTAPSLRPSSEPDSESESASASSERPSGSGPDRLAHADGTDRADRPDARTTTEAAPSRNITLIIVGVRSMPAQSQSPTDSPAMPGQGDDNPEPVPASSSRSGNGERRGPGMTEVPASPAVSRRSSNPLSFGRLRASNLFRSTPASSGLNAESRGGA
ncbi:hypothetical protein KEM52_003131, partial [Ascosphaera acerosa]